MNEFKRLYMFIGCELQTPKGNGIFCGISSVGEIYVKYGDKLDSFPGDQVKPILYDQDEIMLNTNRLKKYIRVHQSSNGGKLALSCSMNTELFAELIESEVDVFGWIQEGKAIKKPLDEDELTW